MLGIVGLLGALLAGGHLKYPPAANSGSLESPGLASWVLYALFSGFIHMFPQRRRQGRPCDRLQQPDVRAERNREVVRGREQDRSRHAPGAQRFLAQAEQLAEEDDPGVDREELLHPDPKGEAAPGEQRPGSGPGGAGRSAKLCHEKSSNTEWIAAGKVIPEIVEVLKVRDKEVQKKALETLHTLVQNNFKNRDEMVQVGGLDQVVKCLGKNKLSHPAVALLQELLQGDGASVCEKLCEDKSAFLYLVMLQNERNVTAKLILD